MNKDEMIEEIAVGEITIGKAKQLYELLEKYFREATLDEVKDVIRNPVYIMVDDISAPYIEIADLEKIIDNLRGSDE